MLLPTVVLKTARQSRHPWIFRKMVETPRGFDLEPGSLVRIRDRDGRPAGYGFYHPVNTIALRVLSDDPGEPVDAAFLRRRLARAAELRESVLGLPARTDGYRLLHGEADGFPALVLDRLGAWLVAEPFAVGWAHLADDLAAAARDLWPDRKLCFRADARTALKEGADFSAAEKKYPAPASVEVRENGLWFRVDMAHGHKTGFFADQRENRWAARALAAGRTVLDCCCYHGGFALSALAGGATRVTALDLDEAAIAAAQANLALNVARGTLSGAAAGRAEFLHEDAYDALRAAAAAGRRYGLVILDPPKFAQNREGVEPALRRYADLNRLGMAVVEPGGFLITCSCSGAVPRERWLSTVRQAAGLARCSMQILEVRGPGADHPVAADFPEGDYLKVIFARVWPDTRPALPSPRPAKTARRETERDDEGGAGAAERPTERNRGPSTRRFDDRGRRPDRRPPPAANRPARRRP